MIYWLWEWSNCLWEYSNEKDERLVNPVETGAERYADEDMNFADVEFMRGELIVYL